MPPIRTHELCKYFRSHRGVEVRAIDNVSLTLTERSFVVLSGPSGSGKTTLLSLLGVLDRPTSGRLIYWDRDASISSESELTRIRRRMGFVFQDSMLIRGLSLADNVSYPLIPRGFSRVSRRRISDELLSRLDLSAQSSQCPEELSGGERQRAAIARALAGGPELLLADEPTSNLDPQAGKIVVDLFRELHAAGKTIIVSTHDPMLAAHATHFWELQKGVLLQSD